MDAVRSWPRLTGLAGFESLFIIFPCKFTRVSAELSLSGPGPNSLSIRDFGGSIGSIGLTVAATVALLVAPMCCHAGGASMSFTSGTTFAFVNATGAVTCVLRIFEAGTEVSGGKTVDFGPKGAP